MKLFAGASSRHRHHQAGIHLYDVQHDGRLLVRDIWYEGDAWSLMNLKGSGEFAYHCGFVAPADPNHLDKTLDWEQDLRRSVAALQFDGFRGKLAFTLVSVNGGTLCVKPPSADLKLYLLGFLTNRTMDFGGAAVKGQVVAEHVKAVRKRAHRPGCRRRHRQGHAGVYPRDADPAPHGEAATAHRPRSERQRRAFLPRVGQWQERRPRAGGAEEGSRDEKPSFSPGVQNRPAVGPGDVDVGCLRERRGRPLRIASRSGSRTATRSWSSIWRSR